MGGGSVLSKVSTFFDYHSKFRELSEISQRLSYFYEERPTLQEIQVLILEYKLSLLMSHFLGFNR